MDMINKIISNKKILAAALLVLMIPVMAACGKKDAGTLPEDTDSSIDKITAETEDGISLVYMKDFNVEDYATPGEYKGVEVEVEEPAVTEEEVESVVQRYLQTYPLQVPVEDRAAQNGDIVNVDFEGKMDGVAFDGGTAKGYILQLGAGGFIDGFEDGIVGMEIGETRDLDLAFPDPYTGNLDLSGKPVVFTITLNSMSEEQPAELNDEYVAAQEIEGCSTVDDFKEYFYDNLMESKTEQYQKDKASLAVRKVAGEAVYQEAPEGMVERMTNALLNIMGIYAQTYGMEIGDYVSQAYGGTVEGYEETIREQAGLMAQQYILLAVIAQKEGITLSDEELDEQLTQEAAIYGNGDLEEYKAGMDTEAYRESLLIAKVTEFLGENAVAVAPAASQE